ncbi:MAG: DUF4982 domain-containing protein [Clostridia bacterium]|nr:DUF4982 domain-containing protein [Clostridia bacterium]
MKTITYFNDGWSYRRGNFPEFKAIAKAQTYNDIKTGQLLPFLELETSARYFHSVTLPHDYVIGDRPDKEKNVSEGYLEGDEAWYLKRFRLSEENADKQLFLHFEGIAIESEIYFNGTLLRRNFSAYNPITVDITDFVRFDKVNVLAVHAKQAKQPEGWWYQGGGIYRDIKLIAAEKLSTDIFGIYVKPEKRADSDTWDVKIETTLRNDSMADKNATVISTITDKNNNEIASTKSDCTVEFKDKFIHKQSLTVDSPLLWDTDSPNLYTLKTEVYDSEEKVEETTTRFGFRTIKFDGDKGFFLNGKNIKLKGFCAHQDYGLTGIYLPRRVAKYRLELMKRMGANAYRSAHNLSDENTMSFCDEMGILVYDETRYYSSSPEALSYVKDMLLRDRNHPSVILWSIGNEERIQHLDTGVRIAETMTAYVKKFDDRPTTVACHSDAGVENNIITKAVDVASMNYSLVKHELFHNMYPDKAVILSESCALQTSRGVFFGDDETRNLFDARDHVPNPSAFNGYSRTETWRHVMKYDWLCGSFIWAGIEHRGETWYPRLSSQSGLVDLYLLPKEAYYHTMSQYSEKPMVHICPSSWNFKGLEGVEIPVEVYTNCDSAELFLNGKSFGKVLYRDYEPCKWTVPFTEGELLAIAYDKDGNELCRDTIATTKEPIALKLICETNDVTNDGHDSIVYTCVCLDKDGREVPDADPEVLFEVSGGILLGTGSSVTDHNPPPCNTRKMYAGKISLCVHIPKGAPKVTVVASSGTLLKGYAEYKF